MWRSTEKGFHTIAPPRLWVVGQFEILATSFTGRTGTGSVSDCGVIRPAPGSLASEMGTWGSFGATSAGRDTDRGGYVGHLSGRKPTWRVPIEASASWSNVRRADDPVWRVSGHLFGGAIANYIQLDIIESCLL